MHLHEDVKVFLVYGNSFKGTPLDSDLFYMDIEENYKTRVSAVANHPQGAMVRGVFHVKGGYVFGDYFKDILRPKTTLDFASTWRCLLLFFNLNLCIEINVNLEVDITPPSPGW